MREVLVGKVLGLPVRIGRPDIQPDAIVPQFPREDLQTRINHVLHDACYGSRSMRHGQTVGKGLIVQPDVVNGERIVLAGQTQQEAGRGYRLHEYALHRIAVQATQAERDAAGPNRNAQGGGHDGAGGCRAAGVPNDSAVGAGRAVLYG